MSDFPHEALLMLIALAGGTTAGYVHALFGKPDKPILPLRLWLILFKQHTLTFRNYAQSRVHFEFREQFVAASFAWFFIFFIMLMMVTEQLS